LHFNKGWNAHMNRLLAIRINLIQAECCRGHELGCYGSLRPNSITDTAQQHPPFCSFTFHGFRYPWSTVVQKYYMENSRNRVTLKLHILLCGVMSSSVSCSVPSGTWIISLSSI
jgi:hypothetical protein